MYVASSFVMAFLYVLSQFWIWLSMSLAIVHAASLESLTKVDVSVRWARQSLTYCSYVTAHGPRFLSASGKRIFVSEHSSRSSFDWNGRRFGRDLRLLNSDETRRENLLNRASTHGGKSIGSGFHFDFT